MQEVNSSHGGTFSEGIPHFPFINDMEGLSKCPNCESENYRNGFCFACGEGYRTKQQIFQLITPDGEKNENTNIKSYCECGSEIIGPYSLCKDCYSKYKNNGELY